MTRLTLCHSDQETALFSFEGMNLVIRVRRLRSTRLSDGERSPDP
jgi:hypothetical protein